MRAIAPNEMPPLPERAAAWSRSTKRAGGMFHARDPLGGALCGALMLDRHSSEDAANLGQMQYWGVCPRCIKLGGESPAPKGKERRGEPV